jgi:hypothetical protein
MANLSNINNKFLVTTGGDVGIGATAPEEKLMVSGAIVSTGTNATSFTAGTNRAILDLTSGGARLGHFRGTTGAGSGSVKIYSDSTLGITLDASQNTAFAGNITATTASTTQIEIETSVGSTNTQLVFRNPTYTQDLYMDAVGDFHIYKSATNQFTFKQDGNVGIGTATPVSKLSIDSNGIPIFAAAAMATTGLTVHNSTGGTAIQIGTYDAGAYNYIQSGYVNSAGTPRDLKFYNGSINSLTLDTSGYVGIGTDSPACILNIEDSVASTAPATDANNLLLIENTNAAGSCNIRLRGGDGATRIMYGHNVTGDDKLYITPRANDYSVIFDGSGNVDVSGNLTLGTPAGASQTGYALKLEKTNSGSSVQVGAEIMATAYPANTNGGNLIFKTGNTSAVATTALTIDGAQNVILEPTKKLYLGADTYIDEQSADRFQLIVGGAEYIDIDQDTTYATIGSTAMRDKTNIKGGGTASVTVGDGSNNAYVGLNTTTPLFGCDVNGTMGVSGLARFYSDVKIEGATPGTQSLIINGGVSSTFGISLQYAGVPRAVFDFYPGSGEIRIGGITTNDEYPVIYSDGVASLTFGLGAAPSASFVGSVQFAAYGAGTLVTDASGNITASSDSSLKTRVYEKISGLDEVLELQPKAYYWNKDEKKNIEFGFFADEVKDIIPEAAPLHKDGTYGLLDRGIIAALVNSIQELEARVKELENK